MKKYLSFLLALALTLSLTGPALALEVPAPLPEAEEIMEPAADVETAEAETVAPEAEAPVEAEPEMAETEEIKAAAAPAEGAWDGTVDISWYDPDASEFYLSTPAELAGLAALVNGMTDPKCPAMIGNRDYIESVQVDDYMLVGAGGGNVSDTVYTSRVDFAYKTVYLTADMDMGGVYDGETGAWSGPNWTPIGGKFPMLPEEVSGDCLTLDTRFNGVLDGQGHTIYNLYCDRYAQKGFPYSMAIGVVGFLGGISDTSSTSGQAVFSGGWQPAVRNLVLGSGSILGRRMVGGVIGRIGSTSDGVIVENCANLARVKSTDAKGVGGIVGSGWGKGVIRNCYNGGYITTTYSSPAGGIVGTNEGMDLYNCYNVGTIDTNGQERGRGIGSHDTGVYTVDNCYFLAGSGDDPKAPGYYLGLSTKISVQVTECTEEELKSEEILQRLNANGAAFARDVSGQNGGYPVLWFQNGTSGDTGHITLVQAPGGSIFADRDEAQFGQTVTLSCQPDSGYTLLYYTVDGAAIASNFFTVTGDVTVSAVFTKLKTVSVTIPESQDYYVAVARSGWTLEDGELLWTDRELLRSGDTLLEGNILTVLTYGYEDAAPENPDLEYIDAYRCALTGTEKNADGTYTVSGDGDVTITVDRSTQKKSWESLADTRWYVSGGRKDVYTLTTPEELAGLAYLVNRAGVTFEGLTIQLGNDISLRNTDGTVGTRLWTAIGANLSHPFKGTFDGRGYAVYQLRAEAAGSYAGLFGCCTDAVIQNVSVYGTVVSSAKAAYAAGIAAYLNGGRMENCLNYADITASGTHAGGIAAMMRNGAQIQACFNYGAITAESGLGGIAGLSDGTDDAITACGNFGAITSTGNGTYGQGGIVGRLAGAVRGCVNYGDVGGTDRYIGGIAGYATTKNASSIDGAANCALISSGSTLSTAALGGIVGYGQFLRLGNAENRGTVQPGEGFLSVYCGDLVGRTGTVTETGGNAAIPEFTAAEPRVFPEETKTEYTAVFLADGEVISTVTYAPGDSAVAEPPVPEKDGYIGSWAPYQLGAQDITVLAIYRQILVRDGDVIDADGTYFITWFSSGEITVGDGVNAVLDGSNGASAGFDGLRINVGSGASLTLRNTVLRGETTLLNLAGGSTLTLSGYSELISRTDAADNAQPTIRVSGDLTINGDGNLYVTAGIRNTAIFVETPGSRVTMDSGTVSIYKEDLLGFAGGALDADGSEFYLRGGTLKGHTVSDNVPVMRVGSLTMTGGRMLLQAERAPAVILGPVSASGGSIAAYGHTGNSAEESRAYYGREAIPGFGGNAIFEDLLPFVDLFVTDSYYEAVETCYEAGYFNGTSPDTFSPEGSMTRGMFVTVLYRMAGQPEVSGGSPFQDVPETMYYYKPVCWAVEKGITAGTSATAFSPDAPLTREHVAVFLYRYARLMGDTLSIASTAVPSHGTLSAWAEAEALWALSRGVFDGAMDAMAEPSDFAPRSLVAAAVANYVQKAQTGGAGFTGPLPFTDVRVTDSYYDAVGVCYEHGWFNGTSPATFSPEASMTRAMFVTVLYRLAGQPETAAENPFTDVAPGWYYDAVMWAVSNQITSGTSSTAFSPNAPVTREQAAVFLRRFAGQYGVELPQAIMTPGHGDFSPWAEEACLWALRGGVFSGAESAMAEPGAEASRGLLAVMLANFYPYVQ